MNRGARSRGRARDEAPSTPCRRLADTKQEEARERWREKGSERLSWRCSRLHAHPSRRPPAEQSEATFASSSRRAPALNRRTLSKLAELPPPPPTLRVVFRRMSSREREEPKNVRRRREGTLKTFVCKHALMRSCLLFLRVGIRSAGDYGTKWLAFHVDVRIRARDQNDNPPHSFFALRCDGLPIIHAHLYAQIMARDGSVHPR